MLDQRRKELLEREKRAKALLLDFTTRLVKDGGGKLTLGNIGMVDGVEKAVAELIAVRKLLRESKDEQA